MGQPHLEGAQPRRGTAVRPMRLSLQRRMAEVPAERGGKRRGASGLPAAEAPAAGVPFFVLPKHANFGWAPLAVYT